MMVVFPLRLCLNLSRSPNFISFFLPNTATPGFPFRYYGRNSCTTGRHFETTGLSPHHRRWCGGSCACLGSIWSRHYPIRMGEGNETCFPSVDQITESRTFGFLLAVRLWDFFRQRLDFGPSGILHSPSRRASQKNLFPRRIPRVSPQTPRAL